MLNILPNSLWLLAASYFLPHYEPSPTVPSLTFQLRHEHGLTNNSRIVFSDIPTTRVAALAGAYEIKTRRIGLHRPTTSSIWDKVEVPGPNITDRETLLQLAMMTNNAYSHDPSSKEWYDVGPNWNSVSIRFVLYTLLSPLPPSQPFDCLYYSPPPI
jgi:hypothetical protein